MSTENQKIDIILDCDPGYDDAAAILLAAGNPNVNILAITVVAGNQSIAKVTRNALAIAQVAGLHDVPIAAGATRPLMIEPEVAAEIHGETGLDDATLPEEIVLKTDPRHAVQVIIDTVMSRPAGTVTLVPTGPLTNIALAAGEDLRTAMNRAAKASAISVTREGAATSIPRRSEVEALAV